MSNITSILFKVAQESELSQDEQEALQTWLAASPENFQLYSNIRDEKWLYTEMERYLSYDITGKFDQFISSAEPRSSKAPFSRLYRPWSVAAACLLFISGTWLWLHQQQKPAASRVTASAVVAPGREGAILTLSNGRKILLDTVADGTTVALEEGTAAIVKNGKLVYEGESSKVLFNKMETPKGRQFQLLLPDGTKVWLNAASAIRYPTVFSGTERRVAVQGEAYLEVAKNTNTPFIIDINSKATVKVLGTQLNINAYENENLINTTLLEGAVSVEALSPATASMQPRAVVLKPGEQAQVQQLETTGNQPGTNRATTQEVKVVKQVDTRTVMAWRNGIFSFSGVDFATVMRQLERWYDIEVVYEQSVPSVAIGGEMSSHVSLQQLLGIFDRFHIHYRLEGRRLTILP